MNWTRGPLQQHLHVNAGASPTYAEIRTTITEYQLAHTTFSRLQQNPSPAVSANYNGGAAPMDMGAISKGKHKGKGRGKHKGKKGKKGNKQRKRLRELQSTSTRKLQFTVNKRKRKDGTRNAFHRSTWQSKRKVIQQVNRTRKRTYRLLQVWTTRPHNEELQSLSVQHQRRYTEQWSECRHDATMVRTIQRLWFTLVEPWSITFSSATNLHRGHWRSQQHHLHKQQVDRQQCSRNNSSLDCQLRTHRWQQHQHININVQHYITEKNITGWNCRRFVVTANKTTRSANRSDKTRSNSTTSNIQTTDHGNYSQNK